MKMSRKILLGINNPNCKYKTLNRSVFKNINNEFVAYLLGWISSDGSIYKNTITVCIDKKDKSILQIIKNNLCNELLIKNKKNTNLCYIAINSKEMAQDVRSLLKIGNNKKYDSLRFPKLANDKLSWAFLRGVFDGDGSIRNLDRPSPECSITSSSKLFRMDIQKFCNIPCINDYKEMKLYWNGINAIDFLGKLYDNAKYYLYRKRDLYLDWACWVPMIGGKKNSGNNKLFYWFKTQKNAYAPIKSNSSDSGYDITIVDIKKDFGKTKLYGTGIKVSPAYGWYFDLVSRSSICKSGYILTNGIGVIDRTYRGEILVSLTKIDDSKPDLILPCKVAQLIPRPIIHFDFIESTDLLSETERGEGGFGSTGK
jgi:deoxyuridine 5'-triphosphate nucleotidohydrolase